MLLPTRDAAVVRVPAAFADSDSRRFPTHATVTRAREASALLFPVQVAAASGSVFFPSWISPRALLSDACENNERGGALTYGP